MAKSLRVSTLAKELGVSNKAIIAKCEAEGVPGITNHNSTVKLGLAVTIREWFADGEADTQSSTAAEQASSVDLEEARKPVKKKAAPKKKAPAKAKAKTKVAAQAAGGSDAGADDADAASATAVAEPESTEASAPEATEQTVDAQEAADAARARQEAEDARALAEAKAKARARQEAEAAAEAQSAEPSEPTPATPATPVTPAAPPKKQVNALGTQNVPDRPDVVKPAGEQLTELKKAKLSGPRVIRIEKPEPDAGPRPRGPRGRSAPGDVDGITRSRGPARGGGVRGGGGGDDLGGMGGGRGGGGGGGGGRGGGRGGPSGRRSLSGRRGRNDNLMSGPTKFTKADLDELDARVKGASGYIKQRRRDLRKGRGNSFQAQTAVQTGGKVEIEEPITIKSLSSATGLKAVQIIKFLFSKGVMSTVNSVIDTELAEEVCLDYNIELVVQQQESAEEQVEKQFAERDPVDIQPRPPVVTVMGHVDHGKTSLLDRIRRADVAAHEDGGITQHIGAYRVTVQGQDGDEKSVVFLDTPGHAAFTTMRGRGARMTDIVVLVVAADDGVMPQTIESINHAKAAEVPVVVALNKSDLPGATEDNVQKIYGQLAEHGLNPTAWGGDVEVIKTSAETGDGVNELLEILDLQAEVLELTADYGGPARGTTIEAEMQPGRGSVARVLVQDGQLAVGDFVVVGRAFGRVRDMTDDRGRRVKQVGPATPIELSGIDEVPDAGDKVFATDTLKKAEDVAEQYRDTEREQLLASKTKVTLDNFADAVKAGQVRELRVVLKADVQGSVETLKAQLGEMGNDEVAVRVLHAAVGGVTESDVVLADASDAIVVAFHVAVPTAVREIADERSVDVRSYRVIYDVTDDIKKALEGMLTPDTQEERLGMATCQQVFNISKVGTIAGCIVSEGSIIKAPDTLIRVERDGVVVTADRPLATLKRVKDDAKEVRAGTECGIDVQGFNDVKPGDQLVCYRKVEVARTLDG